MDERSEFSRRVQAALCELAIIRNAPDSAAIMDLAAHYTEIGAELEEFAEAVTWSAFLADKRVQACKETGDPRAANLAARNVVTNAWWRLEDRLRERREE